MIIKVVSAFSQITVDWYYSADGLTQIITHVHFLRNGKGVFTYRESVILPHYVSNATGLGVACELRGGLTRDPNEIVEEHK